jgi:hypothetical protein
MSNPLDVLNLLFGAAAERPNFPHWGCVCLAALGGLISTTAGEALDPIAGQIPSFADHGRRRTYRRKGHSHPAGASFEREENATRRPNIDLRLRELT